MTSIQEIRQAASNADLDFSVGDLLPPSSNSNTGIGSEAIISPNGNVMAVAGGNNRSRLAILRKNDSGTFETELELRVNIDQGGDTTIEGLPVKYIQFLERDPNDITQNGSQVYAPVLQNRKIPATSRDDMGMCFTEDGNRLIIGMGGAQGHHGAVIFDYDTTNGTWEQKQFLYQTDDDGTTRLNNYSDYNNSTKNEFFGQNVSVSADGNTLAVSAKFYGRSTGDGLNGAVYIFRYQGSSLGYVVEKTIKGENGVRFGTKMALSGDGNWLIASRDKDVIKIYKKTSSGWEQQVLPTDVEIGSTSYFTSIDSSYDGSFVVFNYSYNSFARGKTQILKRGEDGNYTIVQEIDSADATWQGYGPLKISSNGKRILVSARANGVNGNKGSARVYDLGAGGFENVTEDLLSSAPAFSPPDIELSSNTLSGAQNNDYMAGLSMNSDGSTILLMSNLIEKLVQSTSFYAQSPSVYVITGIDKPGIDVSVALADPYIYPMRSSTPVKLPDVEACYRLYQSKDTFINAEVAIATKEHGNRMMEFVEKLGYDTKDVITDGYFFSKFFIADGENKMIVDLREKSFSLLEGSDKDFFHLSENNNNAGNKDWNGKAKNVVVEWVNEEGNQMKATVSFFANPHIENGISLSVSNLPQKALGLCVSNYRPKLMRVPSLTTEKHGKIVRQVKKSRNPFQKIAIQSNREKWIMKK